jgi:hypothetical protein
MTEETSSVRPSKIRKLQLGSSTAPPGYHYEGEKCSMLNGKPTLKLRRDKEGPREDMYGDLYAGLEELTYWHTIDRSLKVSLTSR